MPDFSHRENHSNPRLQLEIRFHQAQSLRDALQMFWGTGSHFQSNWVTSHKGGLRNFLLEHEQVLNMRGAGEAYPNELYVCISNAPENTHI